MLCSELFETNPHRIRKQISPVIEQAAASQGFNTSKIWYHGSNKLFRSFREPNDKGINELGVGIYLTDVWNYANSWARNGGYVYECYIRNGEIFDYSKNMKDEAIRRAHKGHSEVMTRQFGENGAYDYDSFVRHILRNNRAGDRFVSRFLKWAGYMGAIDPTSQIPGQIVIFDAVNVFIAARGAGGQWGDRDEPTP